MHKLYSVTNHNSRVIPETKRLLMLMLSFCKRDILMDKSDPEYTLFTEKNNPEAQGEQQFNLEAKSRLKTTVTITLEAGAALDLVVRQVDADGNPLSLQRKSFSN